MSAQLSRNFCGSPDHVLNRRQFLGATAVGVAGLGGLSALSRSALAEELKRKDRRVILLWLAGGASQLETFDPKPGRPTGGPFFDIQTSVPGVRLCELMPKMAERLGKYTAIIRSLNTKDGDHGGASQTMMRGRRDEPNLRYPDLGAIVAKEFSRPAAGVPENVAIYSATEGRNFSRLSPGFLGARYAPVELSEKIGLDNVERPNGLSAEDHQARAHLREFLSSRFTRGRESSAGGRPAG
ncbi:MAG: DUF1501 domain-containing protein, partial [Planctomycetes bacterium]|nr:DUF1501 domain-containing protein [Planctomycetota bacterium]